MVSPLKHKLKLLIGFIFISVIGYSLSVFGYSAPRDKYIRVAINQDATSLNLKINGFYEISDGTTKKILRRARNLKTTVVAYKDSILIGGMELPNSSLLVRSEDSEAIIIDGRRFRGEILLVKKDNTRLLVINRIDLEDYLKGILYHEASHYWPLEALKAQAIVCRTFALYQMQENILQDYDATSDIYSQVYGGRTSERYRTNRAVEETQGEILIYQNKPFPAYYHATCGGHTEDASLLWNIDISPLKGGPCFFCKDSPHFKWHNVVSAKVITDKLVSAGYAIKNIKDIAILGKDKSGRITSLKVVAENKDISILAKDFRNLIGPNIIRSTNFKVGVVGGEVVFEGIGWGHGVGLCQWGAYFMAKRGYSYKRILEYYYPQAQISPSVNH